jgi:predicted permease
VTPHRSLGHRFSPDLWLKDIALAWRGLRRTPGFTAVAVLTLGIGIGVNAVVFTVTNAVLFKGFPLVRGNDRLVYMTSGPGCCVSYPDFEDWRAQATSFEGLAIVHGIPITLADASGFAERHDATEVSAGTFALVGQRPILGRDFTAEDEAAGAAPVAILRSGFWERRFGRDPRVIGRTVRVNGVPTTIVGVMPAGFSFPQNQDVWLPLVKTTEVRRRDVRNTWFVLGRLADGVTLERARAEMETIGRRLGQAYPETNQGRNLLPYVLTFEEFFIGSSAGLIYRAMWGAVAFVLLIACGNLANLTVARAMDRTREVSVRLAIGAGRARVVRQLLIESLMLSAAGGVAGWWIATWGARLYAIAANGPGISGQILGAWFNDILDYSMDGRVLAYVALLSVVAALVFGLAPVVRLWSLDVAAALKDGGRGVAGGRRAARLSRLLVGAEMALAIVLLAGAGVMLRSFLAVYRVDLGFAPANVVTALVSLPDARYPDAASQAAFHDRLVARLDAVPGVDALALASAPPAWNARTSPFEVAGATAVAPRDRPAVATLAVSPPYFRVLGASLVAGREFGEDDRATAMPVAIVNEAFARQHWPRESPLGHRLRLFAGTAPGPWLTVVGIAPNLSQNRIPGVFDPLVYVPQRQRPGGEAWVLARTLTPPAALAADFRRAVHGVDPDLPLVDGPAALVERLARANQYRAVVAGLFATFAAIALLLASVGLYAVVAHAVRRQTQEIGVRMAIGATSLDVVRLVFRQGLVPVAVGLAIGVAGSMAVSRLFQTRLTDVPAIDAATLAVASAALIASAALGCWIPARRAVRVDPVALLHE